MGDDPLGVLIFLLPSELLTTEQSIISSGSTNPSFIQPLTATILKVEPGSYKSDKARFRCNAKSDLL